MSIGKFMSINSFMKTFYWMLVMMIGCAYCQQEQQKSDQTGKIKVNPVVKGPVSATIVSSLPDLVIESIRIEPLKPTSPAGFLAYATIKNIGQTAAFLPRGWRIAAAKFSAWHPDQYNGFESNDNITIASQQSIEVLVCNYRSAETSPPGTFSLSVKADPDNKIGEFRKTNNEKTISVTITGDRPEPKPSSADLIIADMRLDPPAATVEGKFALVVTIKNLGQESAVIPADEIILRETNGRIDEKTVSPDTIKGGATRTFRCVPKKLEVGTSLWTVTIDPWNRIGEADKKNNAKSMQVTIGKR